MASKNRNRTFIGLGIFLIGTGSFFYLSRHKGTTTIESQPAPLDKEVPAIEQIVPSVNDSSSSESKSLPLPSEPSNESSLKSETKPTFTDENYESWPAIGAEFFSEKQKIPEKYQEGIDFLLNTLRYGNIDKMLSQAGGALFNIDDPELVPTYESILLDSDANISSEGLVRLLSLYIYQAPNTETETFKRVITRYQKHPSVPVRHLAEKWPEFRKGK